jgi:hypothetical protein
MSTAKHLAGPFCANPVCQRRGIVILPPLNLVMRHPSAELRAAPDSERLGELLDKYRNAVREATKTFVGPGGLESYSRASQSAASTARSAIEELFRKQAEQLAERIEYIGELHAELGQLRDAQLTPEEAAFAIESDLTRPWSEDLNPEKEALRKAIVSKLRSLSSPEGTKA